LADNVLQHLLLVAIQLQLLQDQRVPLNGLGSGKAYRQPGERGVVLNQVDYGVNAPVDGAAFLVGVGLSVALLAVKLGVFPW